MALVRIDHVLLHALFRSKVVPGVIEREYLRIDTDS